MKDNPSYYAIIPADVRYNNNLSSSEKLMYAEITALSNNNGYCHASNNYFAKLYGVTKTTVSGWVSSLKSEGLLRVEFDKAGKQVVKRRIYPIMDKGNTYTRKEQGGMQEKDNTPIQEKPKDNTTSNNTTSNNIPTLSEVQDYFAENGYSREAAKTMYNYYETSIEDEPNKQFWRDSRGNKVRSWKMKARSVWFKDENKRQESTGISYGVL